MVPFRVCFFTSLFLIFIVPDSEAVDRLFVGDRGGQVVIEVDIDTGDRRVIEMEDYPFILSARNPVADSFETFLFASFDAAQRSAIFRYPLSTGAYSGVSGFVDYNSPDPRGTGPRPNTGFLDAVLTEEGTLLGIDSEIGPIEIDLGTGDRRLLANGLAPEKGPTPPLTAPLDLVVESPESILVADRFQGIFRMDRETGELEIAYPTADFLSPPYNIERMYGGALVHCLSQPDGVVYLFDPVTRTDKILSQGGPFPTGEGPDFEFVWDIAVDRSGRIFVYDLALLAIFEVSPKTGDRTLISGETRGEGPPLLDSFNMPMLNAGFVEVPQRSSISVWKLR